MSPVVEGESEGVRQITTKQVFFTIIDILIIKWQVSVWWSENQYKILKIYYNKRISF